MALEHTALKGMFPAFPTPFDANGAVDVDRLRSLVDTLIDGGASGLVPVGGTGEYTALSPAERTLVVRTTADAARGRVPVVAGVVSPGYAEAIDAGKAFVDAGAAALLLVTPFYVTPSDAGVRAYFARYRDEVGVPLLLYDIPARTRYATPPATIAAMGKEDGTIIGMKACSPDLTAFARTIELVGKDIAVMSGDDLLYVQHILLGGTGGILTSASLLPKAWAQIHASVASGDVAKALHEHRLLAPLLDALFSEPNPGPAKKAFGFIGAGVGPVRLPLVEPTDATLSRVETALKKLPKEWI